MHTFGQENTFTNEWRKTFTQDWNSFNNRTPFAESTFSYLMLGLVTTQKRGTTSTEVEEKLQELGRSIGHRVIETLGKKDHDSKKASKEFKRILGYEEALFLIANRVWPLLFNKKSDGIEISLDGEHYYLIDKSPIPDKFTSYSGRGCPVSSMNLIAGIADTILEDLRFPTEVKVICDPEDDRGIVLSFKRLQPS
jgi:Transport protein particle (TRAPP) component